MNKAMLFIIISGFAGGSVFPLIRIAEENNIPKFAYIFWEAVFTLVFLMLFAAFKKEKFSLKRSEWKYYSFCALTNIVISQTLFFIIADNMPVVTLNLITALTPLFVYSCLILFYGEAVVRNKVWGLICGFIGIVCLLVPSFVEVDYIFSWQWLLFSLLLPVVYTVNRLFVTRFQPHDAPALRLAMGLFFVVSLISGMAMMISNTFYIPFIAPNYGDAALVLHAGLMAIFYMLFFVISKEGAVQNSLTFYLAPLIGAGWGILLFGERLDISFAMALLFIFIGLHLVNKKAEK